MTSDPRVSSARVIAARQQIEDIHDQLIELLAASLVSRAARPTMQLVIRQLKAMGRNLDEGLAECGASAPVDRCRPALDTPSAGQLAPQ